MFERTNNEARRSLVLAQEASRLLKNDSINPSHIILGVLFQDDCNGAQALLQAGLSYDLVYAILDKTYPKDEEFHKNNIVIPFTKPSKQLLETSLREALQLGHSYIGPEHLLLAWIRLMEIEDSPGFGDEVDLAILMQTGKNPRELRSLIIGVLSRYKPTGRELAKNPQITPQEDFAVDVEIPNRLQEALIDKNRRLVSFLATSGKGSDIDTSLLAIVAKLGHMKTNLSFQKSEILGFCIWYGQTLTHLVPIGHPFQQLYEIFMSALYPGLYG
jgi:hypothetical protein